MVEMTDVDSSETTSHYVHAQNCPECVFVRRTTTLCVLEPHDNTNLHAIDFGKYIIYGQEHHAVGVGNEPAGLRQHCVKLLLQIA
jgi:hypothetical protein